MAGQGGGGPRPGLRASASRDCPLRVPCPPHFSPIINCSLQPLFFPIANRVGSASFVDKSQAGRRSQGLLLGPALTSCVAWAVPFSTLGPRVSCINCALTKGFLLFPSVLPFRTRMIQSELLSARLVGTFSLNHWLLSCIKTVPKATRGPITKSSTVS